jgi:hypothetical protein
MKDQKTIAWQKYEDYIEKQLSSPVLTNIMQNIASLHTHFIDDEDDSENEDEDDESYLGLGEKDQSKIISPILPLTAQIIEDISMLSSFDCWIGHTNFDITPSVKNILDSTAGVEVLKVLSRYRFFIGIGKLFDFKEVRKNIEEELI